MAPEQPKRPVGGAFGVFFEDKRHEFTKACAGQKASEVSKMAGIEWKKLTDEQKPPYQKRFLEIKAKYDKDMKAFLAAGGTKEKGVRALRSQKAKAKRKLGKKMKKRGKKMKDANVPKKPAGGGYGQYLAENREEIKKTLPQDHKITDVAKAAGAKWKSLSAKKKKPYEDKYHKKMAEYKVAFEEYKKNHGDAEGCKKKKDANAPKKPAGGSYGEYFAENREEIGKALPKDHKITDLWKAVRAKWKSLADKDRKLYEGKYHKKMAEYHTNMAEYKENNGGAEAKDEEEKEK